MKSKRKGESTCPGENQTEKKNNKNITTGPLRKSFGRGS